MKNMYLIQYKKPESIYTQVSYVGGNDQEEALAKCVDEAVAFHNKYNEKKIKAFDIQILEIKFVGEYNQIAQELRNDRT